MRFAKDEVEVYLKPHGAHNEHLRYFEERVRRSLHGRKRKMRKLFVADERFVVVVRFGKAFQMHAANALKVAVGFGEGQEHYSLKDVEPVIIPKAQVRRQQHLITHVEASRAGDEEDDQKQWPLNMKAYEGYVNRAATREETALRGTVTISITRGTQQWADGPDTDYGETDPSLPRMITPGEFEPLAGGNGRPYVFEFRPSPLIDADDSAADCENVTSNTEDDRAFARERTKTGRVRMKMTEQFAKRQAERQQMLGSHVHRRDSRLPGTPSPVVSGKRRDIVSSRRQPKICTCAAHATPRQKRYSSRSLRSGAGVSAKDAGEDVLTAGESMSGAEQQVELDPSFVAACPDCHGAKVPRSQRRAFEPKLQEWSSNAQTAEEAVPGSRDCHDEDDDEPLPTGGGSAAAHRTLLQHLGIQTAAHDSVGGAQAHAKLADSPPSTATEERATLQPDDGYSADQYDEPTTTPANGMPTPASTQSAPPESVARAAVANDGGSVSVTQKVARPDDLLATPVATQPAPGRPSGKLPKFTVCAGNDFIDLTADDDAGVSSVQPAGYPSARTISEIKQEAVKGEADGLVTETPSAGSEMPRRGTATPSATSAGSKKRAASMELDGPPHSRRREEAVQEYDTEEEDAEDDAKLAALRTELIRREIEELASKKRLREAKKRKSAGTPMKRNEAADREE
ncbi:hypothetical protein LTR85_003733 [Meristemomyces frigidus]|nr:hypothetical protein LTR85_003733 [Meristemomyces frigidus]